MSHFSAGNRWLALGLWMTAGLASFAQAAAINTHGESLMVPSGKGWGVESDHLRAVVEDPVIPQNGIYYHGGAVIGATSATLPHLYYIWYGNWSGNSAIKLLTNLALGIGRTPYYNINSSYVDASDQPIQRSVTFPKPGAFDNYSEGKDLSDAKVFAVVQNAIASKKLPLDSNGIYFVLTSADVNETSGFCTQYCGWHSNGTYQKQNLRYGFIGNADRCPDACAAQTIGPNNNAGADAMASIIAHELDETVTDPDGDAWYDKFGNENGDKCAWTFGATKVAPNGAKYNLTIAFVNYLVQQNWLNANGGSCVMKY